MLTSRFDKAIQFVRQIHSKQFRRGTNIPYISHLLAVCSIVLEHGGSEDQAIAALLHDALEDQGGEAILEIILQEFNKTIADLVIACSEPVNLKNASWRERKESFLGNLENVPSESLVVIAADKLHNLRCLLMDIHILGDSVFKRFNGGKSGTLWYYNTVSNKLSGRIPKSLEHLLIEANRLLQGIN